MGTLAKDRDPVTYLTASGLAALINFPLWKAAAIGQSGFALQGSSLLASARINPSQFNGILRKTDVNPANGFPTRI